MNLVRFHPEAEAEMTEAAAWYEEQQADLGKRFLSTVQDSLNILWQGIKSDVPVRVREMIEAPCMVK